ALAAFRADTTLTDSDAMAFMMEINRLEALRDAASHGGRTVLVAGDGAQNGNRALLGALATDDGSAPKLDHTHSAPRRAPARPVAHNETPAQPEAGQGDGAQES